MSADGLRQGIRVRTLYDDQAKAKEEASIDLPPQSRFRVGLCLTAFAAVFALLGVRLAYVSFGMEEEFRMIRAETEQPKRREVLDQDGRPLVMNRSAMGLAVDGRDVWDVEEVVRGLNRLFPSIDSARLRERLTNRQYALVLDQITPSERQQVMALGLPGMKFPRTTGRAYPQKSLAAHVVGYTIPGRGGAMGIEKTLDGQGYDDTNAPLKLSLDIVAQQIIEDELAAGIEEFSGKAGWAVLMDVNTGEIRALASLPDFNPNRPGATPPATWRNRAMSDVYELGSAFKPITAMAALDQGVVSINDTFDISQPVTVDGWDIEDYRPKKSVMTTSEVVQYSSNIGTVQIAQKLGLDNFKAMLASLHMTDALQTELPEQREPMLPRDWRPSEFATSSYGHGIAVSPLQLTAAFSAVVNGGIYRIPTFISGGKSEQTRVFDPAMSARMRIVLRKTITEGTGGKAEALGYYPIGKTATADKPQIGGYDDHGELISSFIGAFPGYDPQYVLLVSVDEPEGTKETYGYATAGYVAAPIFRKIVERVAPTLGIMPVGDDVAFDGFVGLRREQATEEQQGSMDALAALLAEAAY